MAMFTVTTLVDETFEGSGDASDGAGLSLREALGLANANGAAEADEITFAAGLAGTLFLTSKQELAITTDGITVNGDTNGDGKADIQISADSTEGANDAESRVLLISNGTDATIGATLNGLVIRDGGGIFLGAGGGILVGSGDELTLTNATVSGNLAGLGGGISGGSGSSITLSNATVSGNRAGTGGGIYGGNGSSITLTNATVSGNEANYGGGIAGPQAAFSISSITLTNATVSGNFATSIAGGLFFNPDSAVALTNSILAGNDAPGTSTDNFLGSLSLVGPNIVGDKFSIDGVNQPGTFALTDIFAVVAPIFPFPLVSGVLADNRGAVQTIALNPDLANPAINSGDATRLVEATVGHDLNGDGDTNDTITTDARGFARIVGFDGGPANPDLGAFEQQIGENFIVTSLADGGTDDFGGGSLAAEQADGQGLSLREALALANADPSDANTITFDPSLAGGTLFLQSGELRITTDRITVDGDINGNGAPDIEISADRSEDQNDSATSRVFLIGEGSFATIGATLNGLVIRDGAANGGGGIHVGPADVLNLTNATVSGNQALADGGGGIFNADFSFLTLFNTTVSGNSAIGSGGGIYGNRTVMNLTNTTISGNSATQSGGGIYGDDSLIQLINATVSGNSAIQSGGGIFGSGGLSGSFTGLHNSIVAGNDAGINDNLAGPLVLGDANIVGDTFALDGVNQPGTFALTDIFAAVAPDPHTGVVSGVLADNGGGVETIALNPDVANPAINSGDATELVEVPGFLDLNGDGDTNDPITTDARGFARSVAFDGGPPNPDLGAFEQQNAVDFVVTTLADGGADDFDDGDLAAEQNDGGGLSLREALALANDDPTNPNTITFDPSLAGGVLTLQSPANPLLQGSALTITSDGIAVDGDIDGDGAPDIEISGDFATGVFLIDDGTAATIGATLNGLVIRDGNAGRGGGISVGNSDELTLTNATVSHNTASLGGAIHGEADATITLINATVSDNFASLAGGISGLSGSSITLTNATVSGNVASGIAGGIYGGGPDSLITLTNTTVSGNRASLPVGAGIFSNGAITLANSIIAGNAPGDLHIGSGTLTFAAGNIVGSTPSTLGGILPGTPGVVIGTPTIIEGTSQAALETVFADVAHNPVTGVLSGVLADNGGGVETIAITHDGIAQNAGDNAALPADAADLDGDANTAEPLPVDARGLPRVAFITVDIGAFELGSVPVNTNDLNADGRSDILWRHDSGGLLSWELNSGAITETHFLGSVDNSYRVEEIADFDGNGTADILWRHDSGFVISWDMNHGDQTGYHGIGPADPADEIAGTGDFNGDGKFELLWRNADTGVVTWQLNTGPFTDTDLNGDEIQFIRNYGPVTSDWTIVGTGDVNGDGKSDIFWRHDSGQLVSWEVDDGTIIGYNDYGRVGNEYHFEGTGDFNGDGKTGDVLWRHDAGQVVIWDVDNAAVVGYHDLGIVTNDYQIEATGDYNGDGSSDILWRHDSGAVITWELTDGAITGYHNFGHVDPVWQVQPPV